MADRVSDLVADLERRTEAASRLAAQNAAALAELERELADGLERLKAAASARTELERELADGRTRADDLRKLWNAAAAEAARLRGERTELYRAIDRLFMAATLAGVYGVVTTVVLFLGLWGCP